MGFIDSAEQDELLYPIEIVERRLLADTEGAGTHVGAGSLRVEYRATASALAATYSADGAVNLPQGVHGGGEAGGAAQFHRDGEGLVTPLPASASVTLAPGESIIAVTPGGGGYGDAKRRNRERVASAIENMLLTPARARAVYGFDVGTVP